MVLRSGRGACSGKYCPCSASRFWSEASVIPACTETVRSAASWAIKPSNDVITTTRSTAAGGFPSPIFVPPPQGTTRRPRSEATRSRSESSSTVRGATTEEGVRPSTAYSDKRSSGSKDPASTTSRRSADREVAEVTSLPTRMRRGQPWPRRGVGRCALVRGRRGISCPD